MTHETQWLPGLIALGIGLAIALVWTLRARMQGRTEGEALSDGGTRDDASRAPARREATEGDASEARPSPDHPATPTSPGGAARPGTTPMPDVDDWDVRVQSRMEALRELMAERHLHSEAQFHAEKARLERAAADAMRARDAARASHEAGALQRGVSARSDEPRSSERPRAGTSPTSAETATAPAPNTASATAAPAGRSRTQPSRPAGGGFLGDRPALRGALYGGGGVGFLVLLYVLAVRDATPRAEGQEMTGRDPNAAVEGIAPRGAPPVSGPDLDGYRERLRADPNDTEAAAELSHLLLMQQGWSEAVEVVERGLGVDPFHVELRIHRAVLLAPMGQMSRAIEQLGHLADWPGGSEALLFRGSIALQTGSPDVALASFERYLEIAPASEHPEAIVRQVERLRNDPMARGSSAPGR